MTIPIKCPGCQAAFDVPGHLTGKTIRCTSCKTQLTVSAATPAPRTAAAATPPKSGEGKPFGWAANSQPAASPPKPAARAPEPLSLDDEPVSATSAPAARPAAPAVKPASGPVAKPAPTRQTPGTNGEKTAPSKPVSRRHDDDDDDDDDDDRPARRRKKRGDDGSPAAMILLIGGGLLGLCAIAGVAIWLMLDSDKKEVAKADSSTPPPAQTSTTPPGNTQQKPPGGSVDPDITPKGENPTPGGAADGMPPGGGLPTRPPSPPGGASPEGVPMPMTPGGPATPLPAPGGGNWQSFVLDGFSAELPGVPTAMTQPAPGIGSMKLHMLPVNGEQAAFFIMALDLPVDVGSNPAMVRQMFDGFASGFDKGAGGAAPNPGMPGGVPRPGMPNQPGFGPPPGPPMPNPGGFGPGTPPPQPGFGGFGPGFGRFGKKDAKIAIGTRSETKQDGHPAMEVTVVDRSGGDRQVGTLRVVLAGKKVFFFGGFADNFATFSTDLQRFMGSVKITVPAGGGLAMGPNPGTPIPGSEPGAAMPGGIGGQPGGFGGQPGFPGQLNPGFGAQPPPGAETRPPLAGKVEPFFAIAFDTEKNEVYTVSSRLLSGSKIAGTLRRYSYPDFKPKGQYNLAHLSTRAAIDPKTGLLYLASVTTPTVSLLQQRLERTTASGNVEIIDLAPIRAGKVEEKTEVKPVATVPMGATIRGLELSPDGKSLFLVVSRTVAKQTKSYLRLVDTADRKVAKEKELPEPAFDMCLSADGTQILVTEFPTSKNKAINVLSYDVATWTLKTIPLPAATTDIASAKGGTLVSAVIGTGDARAAKLYVSGVEGGDQELTNFGWKAAHNNYVEFSPDGKYLFVGSYGGAQAGFDAYEVSDPTSPRGYKKVSSVRQAGDRFVGGHFHVSPDSTHIVFHSGAVLAVDKLTENASGTDLLGPNDGTGGSNGFPQGPGRAMPGGNPGVVPPGGMPGGGGAIPGMPGPGGNPGVVPPGGGGAVPALPPGSVAPPGGP